MSPSQLIFLSGQLSPPEGRVFWSHANSGPGGLRSATWCVTSVRPPPPSRSGDRTSRDSRELSPGEIAGL